MIPSVLRVAGAALLLATVPAAWTTAAAQTADSGWNILSPGAGQCLEVAESRRGGAVVLGQCGNAADRPFQTWTLRGDQYLNVASGLCLDVAEARAGGRVVVDVCAAPSQRPYQYWTAAEPGREVNTATGLCLDAGETAAGYRAVVETCGDDATRPLQRWVALNLVGPGTGAVAPPAPGGGPATAPVPDGFVWQYNRFVSPDVFQTRLSVTYGIPETDAVQASLTCQIGNRGPYALVLLSMPLGNLAGGQGVQVLVSGDAGYGEVFEASAFRSEVGIEGVEFGVGLDSGLLAALRDLSVLRYGLPGQPEVTLPLDGSSVPMLEFLSDCAMIGDLSTTTTAFLGVGGDPCAGLGQLRSLDSSTPQFARFENRSDGYRVVNWVDFEGRQIQYGALNPGEVMEINTFLTHPWVITDGPGNCLQVIEVRAGVESYPIDAPGRDLGSE